jgi:outer membrane protein OmpA-like peptidoglycan-associated protein
MNLQKRRPGAVLVTALAALAAACAAKHAPTSVERGQSLVALLPDPETNKTGRATVWNKAGSADLDSERKAVLSSEKQMGRVAKLSDDDVERLFGAALEALPPEPRNFTLYFKFESDELTEESTQLVPTILAVVKKRSDPEVAVVGHTDTMGPPKANVELAMKRAAFVGKLLVAAGLSGSIIELSSHGEAALLIRTPDETPEPRNRRVEITVR